MGILETLGWRESAAPPQRPRVVGFAKPPQGTITASAARVDGQEQRRNRNEPVRLTLQWQDRALAHYDETPECWYASQFYARPLSKLRLFPAIREANGEITEVDDEGAREVLDRVRDHAGGHAAILKSYGKLQFLIGDGYLIATEDGGEVWEYVSPSELTTSDGGRTFRRLKAPNVLAEEYDGDGAPISNLTAGDAIKAFRMWTPHPKHSRWPDSPIKATLGILDQLASLDRSAEARLLSRLAGSGILAISDELSLPDLEDEGDEDAENDLLIAQLTEHLLAPIRQPGAVSQLIPYILRVSTLGRPLDELLYHLKMYDPQETFPEMERQTQLVKRFATGSDMPIEVMTGIGASNHWNGWQVNEDSWKAHQEPFAIQFCNDLTSAYYRQAAVEAQVRDAEKLIVWYDPAAVVVHPDRGKDANELHDRGALSDAGLRRAHGVDESEAPSEDEKLTWLAVKMRDPNLAVSVYGEEKIGTGGAGTEKQPPPGAPSQVDSPNGSQAITASMAGTRIAMLLGAAEGAVTRCRSQAGSRLRTRAQRGNGRGCAECLETIDGVPPHLVAATLGPERIAALDVAAVAALVAGASDEFVITATRLGIPEEFARRLGDHLERHAAQTLLEHDPPQLPNGFGQYLARLEG